MPLERFYDNLPNQSMNTYATALDDAESLEGRSLLDLLNSRGSTWDLRARSTAAARALVDTLHTARSDKKRRRLACRDAIVDWLYSRDALIPPGVDRSQILHDRRGHFFAEPFTADDLDAAAAWLYRNSLINGTMIAEAHGPVIAHLTDSGVKCAEDFSSDTSAYLERQQFRVPGPTVHIGTSGPVQIAGDNARQVQNIGTSANDLRQMIIGIATIVRALVPHVPDADVEEQAALTAVSDQGVDQSALERFRAWTLNTVRAGTNAAAVAAVSSATTTLLIEAARLASHLG